MTQLAQDDIVQIDRSTRVLAENPDEDEIEIVNGILSGQMPGYEVLPNAVWDDPIWEGPIENVRVRDFSPPLAELKDHFAPLVRPDVGTIEVTDASQDPGVRPEPGIIRIPAASRELVDQEADLRMYRVRHVEWPDDFPYITVLISRRGEGIVVASS